MKKGKISWLLALADVLDFGIAIQVFWNVLRGLEAQVLWGAINLSVWELLGGTFLEAALG